MGADQQFCLRWNNFHTNITSAFESLRDDEDFVDITLACEGKQVKAHKMVLSACSPYFRSLLKGNPCQHPIVFLKDVTFANLSSILDFMYHGEVNVSNNELATFLNTAEALKVRGLAEDDKKKDSESCNESSSPPPPREPPDPGAPRPEEGNTADTHLSDSPPPKRQRRRSGASVHSTEDTNETVLSEVRECASVKNEPQDFNEDDDILMSHSLETTELIKTDSHGEDNSEERSFGPSESVTISRSQAAMQQLQESFSSFLPGMGQSSGFLSHGASDMSRPPPFPMEGVQGLPPGISALPGPSMSQGGGAASQDASQGKPRILYTPAECPLCNRVFFNKYSLKRHMIQSHGENRVHTRPYVVYHKQFSQEVRPFFGNNLNFSTTSSDGANADLSGHDVTIVEGTIKKSSNDSSVNINSSVLDGNEELSEQEIPISYQWESCKSSSNVVNVPYDHPSTTHISSCGRSSSKNSPFDSVVTRTINQARSTDSSNDTPTLDPNPNISSQ